MLQWGEICRNLLRAHESIRAIYEDNDATRKDRNVRRRHWMLGDQRTPGGATVSTFRAATVICFTSSSISPLYIVLAHIYVNVFVVICFYMYAVLHVGCT